MMLPTSGLDATRATHREDHINIHSRLNQIIIPDSPNGSNDTTNLQAALDAGSGKLIYVPAGRYWVSPVTGLTVKSNTILEFAPGAEWCIIPSDKPSYSLLQLTNVSNVTIRGGKIIGDKDTHTGATGEHGHGINIQGGADIRLEGMTVVNMWGDGIYIGSGAAIPERITLTDCRAINNRRQGMSVASIKYLSVTRCAFLVTSGTMPEGGVDLEPNTAANLIRHVQFTDCLFNGNYVGLYLSGRESPMEYIRINNCVFADNRLAAVVVGYTSNTVFAYCDSVRNPQFMNGQSQYYTLVNCTHVGPVAT